jgi:hypothetical protein
LLCSSDPLSNPKPWIARHTDASITPGKCGEMFNSIISIFPFWCAKPTTEVRK